MDHSISLLSRRTHIIPFTKFTKAAAKPLLPQAGVVVGHSPQPLDRIPGGKIRPSESIRIGRQERRQQTPVGTPLLLLSAVGFHASFLHLGLRGA